MELLAPAGDMDCLKAAIHNGADAVYFGAPKFNARHNAQNFESIAAVTDYAHIFGVKAYLTLNTLIFDRELNDWVDTAIEAANCGVDAFIVQDMGCARLLGEFAPGVPLHASTQMGIYNSLSAQTIKKLGFCRLVPPREARLADAAAIKRKTGLELELFVHGALCYCFSGQCHMSGQFGGRSGNRGECAQPCRLEYSIDGKRAYLLSTKDLCLVDPLAELRKAGVDSLKIEGRMRRPEYVAAVTRVYRKALDGGKINSQDREELLLAFNRGNFTRGRLLGASDILFIKAPNHQGISAGTVAKVAGTTVSLKKPLVTLKRGDLVRAALPQAPALSVKEVIKSGTLRLDKTTGLKPQVELRLVSRGSPPHGQKKIALDAEIDIKLGHKTYLKVRSGKNTCELCGGITAEKAKNAPIDKERIIAQLRKTGGSNFEFHNVKVNVEDGVALPISEINALRRAAIDGLSREITSSYHRNFPARSQKISFSGSPKRPAPLLAGAVYTSEQLAAIEEFVDVLYLPRGMEYCGGKPVIYAYPLLADEKDIVHFNLPPANVLLNYPMNGRGLLGDYGLNITNSKTLEILREFGFVRATLSPELNAAQINDISAPAGMETEVIVYGRQRLMLTENCPLDCGKEKCLLNNGASLRDRKNKKFPLIRLAGGECRIAILNSSPLYMADKLKDIRADVFRLDFTVETAKQCAGIAQSYRSALSEKTPLPPDFEFNRGRFYGSR